MKRLLTILLLMVIVAISGCEKDPLIEDLVVGDKYGGGFIMGIDDPTKGTMFIMWPEDLGPLFANEIDAQCETYRKLSGFDDWRVPESWELGLIINPLKNRLDYFGMKDDFYWCRNSEIFILYDVTPTTTHIVWPEPKKSYLFRPVRLIYY